MTNVTLKVLVNVSQEVASCNTPVPPSPPPDDYLTLVMAEALLEECLQDNMDLLRSLTPLLDKTQPKLCRAKSLLNAVLSRGCLTVSLRSRPRTPPQSVRV